MRKKAEEAGLAPGKKVQILYTSIMRDGVNRKVVRTETRTVLAMYAHHFTVDAGNYLESFRYTQMFANEEVQVRLL